MAAHRDLRHLRRDRRLLRLGLHPAGQLLRGRPAGPDTRYIAVREGRVRRPHLHRPRLDPEVHRGQLEAVAADLSQRGQPAERHAGTLRAQEPASDREPDDDVRFPAPASRAPGAAGTVRAQDEPPDRRQLPAALSRSAGRPGDLPSYRGGQRARASRDHRPYPSLTGQDAAQREFRRVGDALDGITLQWVAESWSWAETYTVDLGEFPVVAAVRWRWR